MNPKKNPRDFSKVSLILDVILIISLAISLLAYFLNLYPLSKNVFIILSFIGLIPVIRSAILALIKRRVTIDLLASIALIFSFLAREWYSAAFINLMIAFARVFSVWTQMRTKNIIEHLLKFRPLLVKIKRNEQILEIPSAHVKVGDLVVVESGDRVPVDGKVIQGQASLNEATLTGESELILKKVNDQVFSGTLNESGSLLVLAEKVGEESTLSKIIALIEGASRKKAKTERIANRFTQWYVLAMLVGSIALYFILHNTNMVLAVLLVICADDIAVAIPLTFTIAIARGAQRGILIKGSDVLEKLSRVKFFVTDKTGTLTLGKPKIREVHIFSKISETQFLKLLGTATASSHHPIDEAIIRYVESRGIRVEAPDEFYETMGEGVTVVSNKQKILAGRTLFLEENKIEITPQECKVIEKVRSLGLGICAVGLNNKIIGFVGVEDEVRPYAAHAIQIVKDLGVKSWIILSGDNENVTAKVAKEVNIEEYHANLKPEDKIKFIEQVKKKDKGMLAMIGDGVNDAAALSLADVSIAMGAIGADAAIEAADIALMNDKLNRIPEAMLLSKRTMEIVKQNFFIWGSVNIIGLMLVFGGVLNPMGAATFNFVTDFFPILNALRMSTFSANIKLKTTPPTEN